MFTSEQELAIREAVAYECDRQHVGLDRREFLYSAYCRAYAVVLSGTALPTMDLLLSLAGELEPDNQGRLRITPVTFADGGSSAEASTLPRVVSNLLDNAGTFTASEEDVRHWVKEFLWIHPFADGNGRMGFLLYNWLRGSWATPEQMPYFFGE